MRKFVGLGVGGRDVSFCLITLAGKLGCRLFIACRGVAGQPLGFGLSRDDLVLSQTFRVGELDREGNTLSSRFLGIAFGLGLGSTHVISRHTFGFGKLCRG